MGIYLNRDLQVEDDGDLSIEYGDLVVASAQDSIKQYILTWTLTTRGSFTFDTDVGWGAEGFIGRPNVPFTHDAMEKDLGFAFSLAQELSLNDLTYTASFIGPDIAAITLRFDGTIIEKDGTSPPDNIVMGFSFPFYDGRIQQEVGV